MLDTSFPTLLKHGIQRGFLNLRRERQWGTALGALFGVFLLLQLLLITLLGLEGIQSLLRARTDLRLEIRAEATDDQIQNFYSSLQELPFVRNTVLITKEQAYDRTKNTDPELIAFIEEFNIKNPFSDTIGVTLKSLDDYKTFSSFIEREQWNAVVDPTFLSEVTDQEKQVFELLKVTRAGRTMTILILALTLAALTFITTELVRRRALARSDEVLVERLAGASPMGILMPFVTEAVILFALSIILSTVFLVALLAVLPVIIPALGPHGVLSALRAEVAPLLVSMLPLLIAAELLLAPFVAWIGAWLGIQPQVKNPKIAFAV